MFLMNSFKFYEKQILTNVNIFCIINIVNNKEVDIVKKNIMLNKGFTLIELLGVIVILSLLMALIFPRIINTIRDSSKKSDELNKELIYNAAKIYIQNNKEYYKKKNNAVYCISLDDLVKEDLLKSPIKLSNDDDITQIKSIEVTYDSKFNYEIINKDACKEIIPYEDAVLKGSDPELVDGLTPVIYNEDHWEIADITTKWYDYLNLQWANAVILNDNVSKEPGTIIYPDGENINIKAMFVWIPRYSYTIGNTYGVQLEGGNKPSRVTPGAIDIKFIEKNTKENGIAAYNGDSPTEWHTHPAFTFGSEELSGIWVGKFETSHISGTKSLTCTNENCTDADSLRILPNVVSLNNNTVSKFFFATRSMTREGNPFKLNSSTTDSHMMKNSEWGAVAYLSQSKYGKYGNIDYNGANKEIYVNNSRSYYTGRSGGAPGGSTPTNGTYTDQTSTDQYNTTGYYTYDGYLLNYNTNEKSNTRDILKGTGASTTGNIYGIYDMSGGAWDYVMGNYSDTSKSSGFASTWFSTNKKYYDGYTITTPASACNGEVCYGHALSETTKWYNDYAVFVSTNSPWLLRGGLSSWPASTGIGSFSSRLGEANIGYSFRVVFALTSDI